MTVVSGKFESPVRGKLESLSKELAGKKESAASRRERRINAFHPTYRERIRELATHSSALEDLGDSYPALLFALATGFATPAARQRAIEAVCAGVSLREAAEGLGLAWWLRKLPACAFTGPLPELPLDPDFSLRIAGLTPRDARLSAAWIVRVGHGYHAAGRSFALWIARQPNLGDPPEELFAYMAAWAWFSGRPGLLGHRLLRRPWTPEMSFKKAREELTVWRQRLGLIDCLGAGIETPWLADGTAAGFTFVALRSPHDFIAESEALDNCLDQYASQLRSGSTAVFSIRKGERRLGCVEIGLHDEDVTMPTIVQLRGVRNRRATPEMWQATFSWLGSQRLEPLSPQRNLPSSAQRTEARRQLWGPYLDFLSGTSLDAPFRRLIREDSRPMGTVRRLVAQRRAGERQPAQADAREHVQLDPPTRTTPSRA